MIVDVEKLYNTTDAMVWTKTFMEVIQERSELALDEGFMVGWFANAIETGRRISNDLESYRNSATDSSSQTGSK